MNVLRQLLPEADLFDAASDAEMASADTLLETPEERAALESAMRLFRFQMNQLACHHYCPGTWKATRTARSQVPDNDTFVLDSDQQIQKLAKHRLSVTAAAFEAWQADPRDPQKRVNALSAAYFYKDTFDDDQFMRRFEQLDEQTAA